MLQKKNKTNEKDCIEDGSLDALLRSKENKTNTLNEALNSLTNFEIEYAENSNKLWVETDFSEVITESRPTVDMKKAYIDYQLKELVAKISREESNIEILKNDLKCIDANIKAQMKYLDVFCNLDEGIV